MKPAPAKEYSRACSRFRVTYSLNQLILLQIYVGPSSCLICGSMATMRISSCYMQTSRLPVLPLPDELFSDFSASKSVDRRILCHATDFKAPKLWKGSSGSLYILLRISKISLSYLAHPGYIYRLVWAISWASFLFLFDPFTTFELQNPSHDVLRLHNIGKSSDVEAPKLWKGRSGA